MPHVGKVIVDGVLDPAAQTASPQLSHRDTMAVASPAGKRAAGEPMIAGL
jgi:hypothetical protein